MTQHAASASRQTGWWGLYANIPLYIRIVIGLVIGLLIGLTFVTHVGQLDDQIRNLEQQLDTLRAEKAPGADKSNDETKLEEELDALKTAKTNKQKKYSGWLKPISSVVLTLLSALATPLIFCSVVHALVTAQAGGKLGVRMFMILMFNTTVAILVGLFIANLLKPGEHVTVKPDEYKASLGEKKAFNLFDHLISKLPTSVVKPFVENDTIAIIMLALAGGIALRMVKNQQVAVGKDDYQTLIHLLDGIFQCVLFLLHGLFHLVPFAVLAVVAETVGIKGFAMFKALGWFVLAVLLALSLQAIWYLVIVRLASWVRPGSFLRGASDALLTAFSTASSAATLPVTYQCMTKKIGVREESASMGVMVGGTFNHDGTALYEAMAALFISQILGHHLDFGQQAIVVIMSIIASVGAAGIPEAGLVTMIAVFTAVGLPKEYIPLLLTVDWFLDRCRTAINVMGDMCSTCILDGKEPPSETAVAS